MCFPCVLVRRMLASGIRFVLVSTPLYFLSFYTLYPRNPGKSTYEKCKAKFPHIQALLLLQSWFEKGRISCAIED